MMSSTGPSTAPNQCGVQVANSTASPGSTGVRRALLLRFWSDDVTRLADGPAELDAEDVERLRAAGVTVDAMFHTSVPGLFAAGDVSTQAVPSVANAVAAGSSASAMIVQALMAEAHGLTPVGAGSEESAGVLTSGSRSG
jgi:hypothetical protein